MAMHHLLIINIFYEVVLLLPYFFIYYFLPIRSNADAASIRLIHSRSAELSLNARSRAGTLLFWQKTSVSEVIPQPRALLRCLDSTLATFAEKIKLRPRLLHPTSNTSNRPTLPSFLPQQGSSFVWEWVFSIGLLKLRLKLIKIEKRILEEKKSFFFSAQVCTYTLAWEFLTVLKNLSVKSAQQFFVFLFGVVKLIDTYEQICFAFRCRN